MRISEAKNHVNTEVTIQGWMYNKRGSGKILFLQLRDGSGFMQGIVSQNDVGEKVWEQAEKLTIESSVQITGTISQHPKKEDVFELQVSDIEIIQLVEEEYPIGKKEHGPDFLLQHRHLWLRSKRQWAVQKVRNTIINSMYEFFAQEGFIKIDSPIFTPNACEGTTTLFGLEYFDLGTVYLSQSGQLYLEAAIQSVGRCFDFGPVFRAEKSKTRRHLTEFWMLNAEAAFVDHTENLRIQEDLIYFVIQKVLQVHGRELEILERDLASLQKIKKPFLRKTHAEAVEELQKLGSKITTEDDLGGEDETLLTEKYDQPIFVEKYPAKVKAFYMKRDTENEDLALCADMLAPEGYGEVIGGSEREDDYDILLKRIREHRLSEEDFQWYLDLRKFGSVPHSGFGVGLERLVGWMCGLKHVRETIPFPRTIYRVTP